MSSSKPSSVTIEEAVARMVNLKCLPAGYSLIEITEAFLKAAEIDYDNAALERATKEEVQRLEDRLEVCQTRQLLAQQLLKKLSLDVRNIDSSNLTRADDSTNMDRLTLESVEKWASENFGIDLPEWQLDVEKPKIPEGAKWKDINIRIYKNFTLSVFYKNQPVPIIRGKHFREIDLMGIKAKEPNWMGKILITMSIVKKYPHDAEKGRLRKKEVSGLRYILKGLLETDEDPFYPFESVKFWSPKFKIIDDQKNAEKRLKEKAISLGIKDDDNQRKLRREPAGGEAIENKGERFWIDPTTGELVFDDDSEADDFEWKDDEAQKYLDEHDQE